MIGSTIIYLDSVDSTNNYAAKELLTKSLNDGTIFVAECQEAGRGQAGNFWESTPGLNLTFSIVLFPENLSFSRQFFLSKAVALAVHDFLKDYTDLATVKWPNDIYVGDKKIAGILIETAITSGKISRAIVGIGLNINQQTFVSDAPNPISLIHLTGTNLSPKDALKLLTSNLQNRYEQLNHEAYARLDADYANVLYKMGVWSNFKADGKSLEGMIKGVHPDGSLLVQERNGSSRNYYFKELVFL